MAKPWVPYVVQQGDHLNKLAYRFGSDADTVWNNEKNKDLKARRKNRDTLCPGDVLFVPSELPDALSLKAHTKNAYTATVPTVAVSLKIQSRQSVAGKAFEVYGLGGEKPLTGTCTADGEIAFRAPVSARALEVKLPDLALCIPVLLGDLDPIEETSGIVQRLRNLGYLPPSGGQVSSDGLAEAVASFQRACRLPPTGVMDEATGTALESA